MAGRIIPRKAAETNLLLLFCVVWLMPSRSLTQNDAYARAAALVRGHQWDAGLAALAPLLRAEPPNPQVLNLAGLALTGKGDTLQANSFFERARAVDPNFLPALKNLAVNEYNVGAFHEAERHFSRALKLAPDDPVVNLYSGQLAYKERNFSIAAETLPKAQPFLSKDANLAAQLAISYLNLGRQREAELLLPSAPPVRLQPESQFILGVKLADAGLDETALPYFEAAAAGAGNSFNAVFDLALCYLHLKRYAEATTRLNQAVAKGQETAELDNLLAEAYEGNHETQRAIDALRRAIALAPEDENNYLDFASLCIDHQDYPAALKVLDIGLRVKPESDRLFFERGILHAVQDNFRLAEDDFKKAASLSPEKNSNYKGLGVLYLESGHATQAVDTLRQRLQTKPNDADLLYLLGEALLRAQAQPGSGGYREAQAAFEKAVRLDPKACLPHVSLGKMYLEQGRTPEAVAQLEEAKAADPAEKSTYWQLANAYRKLGEPEKQRAALKQLQDLNAQERSTTRERAGQAEGRPLATK